MTMKYNEKVLEHFKNPRNAGEMQNPDASATEGSLACGDMMTIYIKLEGDVIADIMFQSYGCAANIATGSVLTEMVKGKTIEEARKVTWEDVVGALGDLPAIKYHCSNLAIETLQKAVDDAEKARASRKAPAKASGQKEEKNRKTGRKK